MEVTDVVKLGPGIEAVTSAELPAGIGGKAAAVASGASPEPAPFLRTKPAKSCRKSVKSECTHCEIAGCFITQPVTVTTMDDWHTGPNGLTGYGGPVLEEEKSDNVQ
mgnify:CR=1 FL=1